MDGDLPAPVVAALTIVAIGGWMLIAEIRRRRRLAGTTTAADRDHRHDREGSVETHEHEVGEPLEGGFGCWSCLRRSRT